MFTTDFKALQEAVSTAKKLYSIFDRVSLGHSSGRLNNQHQPRPLTNENIVRVGKSYSKDDLLIGLEKDFKRLEDLNIDNDEAQTDTFYYLLQKYGWRIADPEKEEETSLAVAYCDSFRVKKVLDNVRDGERFILLKGDLSGIQKYIYGNIQPKRAGGMVKIAKKLRGRSVLVSLLSDFLANAVLRELDLPVWHLMFAGGGHFNLLLPDNPKILATLEKLIPELDSEMRDRFGDNLQLVIAKETFSKNEITNDIGACFSKINAELERQKLREHFNDLRDRFYPSQVEIDKKEIKKKLFEDWEIQIGERFPKQKVLIEAVTDLISAERERAEVPELFSIQLLNHSYSLLIAENYGVAGELLSDFSGLVSAQVLLINDTDFLPEAGRWSNKISFGFRFLGRTVPTTEDLNSGRERPQTFEEIVESDELKMLGAMRLDVDDLGFIFSRGIKGVTLGEIVTLSREMQYFFSAHFDQLAAQQNYNLYVVYSGGDDAFVAGKWDNLIAFAQQLHQDFQDFVFGNEDLHFSAGIFMGNPHYPIGKISHDAENLQKASKDSNDRKNRVSLFNHIMSWSSFNSKIELGQIFEEALETKKANSELAADQMLGQNEYRGKLNSAFAYRILQLVKSSFYERSGVDSSGQRYARGSLDIRRFARNVENMRYLFARHGYDRKRSEEVVGKLETALIGDFLKSFDFGADAQIKSTRDYLVALNYALFKQRSKNKTNQNHE